MRRRALLLLARLAALAFALAVAAAPLSDEVKGLG